MKLSKNQINALLTAQLKIGCLVKVKNQSINLGRWKIIEFTSNNIRSQSYALFPIPFTNPSSRRDFPTLEKTLEALTKNEVDQCDSCGHPLPGTLDDVVAVLLKKMEYAGDEDVKLRACDGRKILASEMVEMLKERHPDAIEFCRDIHGAAVRVTELKARRGDA